MLRIWIAPLLAILSTSFLLAQNRTPLINQPLVPDAISPGHSAFLLSVRGTGFEPGVLVEWNGEARRTTFISNSELSARISASDVVKAGTAWITVSNPRSGVSNIIFFPITPSTATISFANSTMAAGGEPHAITTADFNGDGHLDLAVANATDNTVSVMLGNGDGTFRPQVKYPTADTPYSVAAADLNEDGLMDLVLACEDEHAASVLLGNGDGTFQPQAQYPVSGNAEWVAIGDFNADGHLDLAVTNITKNSVSVLLGSGDGSFASAVDFATGKQPLAVATGDLNRDGKLDLAIANENFGSVSVLLGRGDGSFDGHTEYQTGSIPNAVVIADLNGDGLLDLAVSNQGTNTISVLLGAGDGTFGPNIEYAVGVGPHSVDVGDFNADGKLDLAVANQKCHVPPCPPGSVSLLIGNGGGTFKPHRDFATDIRPLGIAIGDFDGDGTLDIATANSGSDSATVLLQH